MGMNKGLAPDLVLSGLDEVFYGAFNPKPMPDMAEVTDSMVFKQSSTDRGGVITELVKDVGLWQVRTELQPLPEGTVIAGDKRTFTVADLAKTLPISKDFFDDEQYDAVTSSVRKMAQKGLLTKRQQGFAIYRGAFTTTLTNDGVALVSDTHTNLNGDTIDNKLTAVLAETSLNDAIQALVEQKDQAGDNVGFQPYCLLVPNRLYKKAAEILGSELKSNTANNDINVYSSKYGIYLKQSNWLGAVNGGSDTAWFLLADDHNVYRWVRQDIQTDLVDYKYSSNFVYQYKAQFREVYGAVSYEGLVGSDGTV